MALGLADYRVTLAKRGGEHIAHLPWSSISWRRVLDDMSDATAQVPIKTSDHPLAWAVQGAEAWVHELVIERGGADIWAGPLLTPKWSAKGVNLTARDLFQWFERRALSLDHDIQGDLADIFVAFVADALREDPSPNISIQPTATGVLGRRKVAAASRTRSADALRELASTGLDFTAVGRQILTGGEEIPTRTLAPITNYVLRNPELTGTGESAASRVIVVGSRQGGGGSSVVGIAGGVAPDTGLVERVFNESAIGDDGSATAAAVTRLDALQEMPLYLTGQLDSRRGPSIDELVPGAVAPVEVQVGCRWLIGEMRLVQVQGTVNVSEQGGVAEQIQVDFAPVGTREVA